jgi:hypothetical protein
VKGKNNAQNNKEFQSVTRLVTTPADNTNKTETNNESENMTKNTIITETVGNPQRDCMNDIIRKTDQVTGKVVFLGTRREFMETVGTDANLRA